jgi:hypothetical protein
MTETALEDAVRRLERAIMRLEQQPRPAPPQPDADALARLERRHQQLRTRVEEAVRSLDRLIGEAG